jgi:prophage regulatory protein
MSVSALYSSLRPKDAADFLGIGRSTLWLWAKTRPDFPRPIRIGPRATIFRADELAEWRDKQRRVVQCAI